MSDHASSPRAALIRKSLVFQLKLLVDGFRDFAMVPVSLVATAVGLIRSAENPDREFEQVLELGRETEQMINLFGAHGEGVGQGRTLETLVNRAEAVLREQLNKGDVSSQAGEALGKALAKLHASALRPAVQVQGEKEEGRR